MIIQNLVSNQINKAAEQIYSDCILNEKSHLSTFDHIKEVLNNLAIDTIETYCDTIKEKK